MQKVFVSSTVYDLIDARAETAQLLGDMKLHPVVSGISTSSFQPLPDKNSIESCLANLRRCDAIIVLLCQRYGPSLLKTGYPDVSATHLEYNEARKLNIPIRMYVRDRLEAEYRITKANRDAEDLEFLWVRSEEDRKLFALVHEHQKLVKETPISNWYDTFRDTTELKTLVLRDFGPIALRADLKTLIETNRVPIISVGLDVQMPKPGVVQILINVKNVGTVPAYRLSWQLDGDDKEHKEFPVLAPNEATHQFVLLGYDGQDWSRSMDVSYYMPQGHRVVDRYLLGFRPMGTNNVATGATCESKTYHVSSGDARPFVIAE